MKSVLLLCGLAVVAAGYSQAQVTARRKIEKIQPSKHQASRTIPPLTRDQQRARRIAVAEHHPLRVYDGRLYDLTEVVHGINYGLAMGIYRAENFWVNGKVSSVGKDFIIVSREGGKLACIKGHPRQSVIVDDERIDCAAIQDGRFTYTTVLGGQNTVPLYHYGVPLAQSGKKFDVVTRVSADGSVQQAVKFEP